MRWARTLMLAQMLTKAIQANVAHEAGAAAHAKPNKQPPKQECAMTDDAVATTIDPTAPAPTPAPTVSPVAAHVDMSATPEPLSPAPLNPEPANTANTPSTSDNIPPTEPQAVIPPSSATAVPASPPPSAPGGEFSAIDARLQNIADLVQTLSQNPGIHRMLCALLEVDCGDKNAR